MTGRRTASGGAGERTCSLRLVKQAGAGVLSLMVVGCAAFPSEDKTSPKASVAAAPQQNTAVIDKPPADLDAAIAEAQASRKRGDLAASARILSQLVIFLPDEPRVLGEYGKTLASMGRSDDALAFLERAIQLSPADWSLLSAQGVAYDQKSNFAAAEASYARALALKPNEPSVLNNAAMSRMQAGDLDSAEKLLLQASAASSEFPRIAENLALVRNLKEAKTQAAVPGMEPAVSAPPAAVAAGAMLEGSTPARSLPAPEPSPMPTESKETAAEGSTAAEQSRVAMAALPGSSEGKNAARTEGRTSSSVAKAPAEPKSSGAGSRPQAHARSTGAARTKSPLYVQAGAYESQARASALAAALDTLGARVSQAKGKNGHSLYRVRIGPFLNAEQANAAIVQAQALGHADVKIVSD